MNELASRISRAMAILVALLVYLLSAMGGARLEAALLRTAVAWLATWAVAEFLSRKVLHTLLLRVMADRKDSNIDVTVR